jgi:hypothetical protein
MKILLLTLLVSAAPALMRAEDAPPCPRFEAVSKVVQPKDLYSRNGRLELTFKYQTRLDSSGNTHYCFTTRTARSRRRCMFIPAMS